jgi:very-short-patch-repair endonuclease
VVWDDRFPEVTVRGTTTRRHREVRVHRSETLCAGDVARLGPLPVTSVARTLVDVAGILDEHAVRRALREAFGNRLVTVPQLVETAHRLAPRPGAARIACPLAADPAPTRSDLEDVVLGLIEGGGLARPHVNVRLTIRGRRVIPDFRWPDHRLVVEADGAAWHDNPVAREDDAQRQALLEAHGERVVRVTWEQATSSPAETLARLVAAGAPTRSTLDRTT